MTPEQLLSTWLQESQSEAFEIFDSHGVSGDQVEQVLGKDAARGYLEIATDKQTVLAESSKTSQPKEKTWVGKCDEHARINSIQNCLINYYNINPVNEANTSEEQEAFERCRAAASYQFCKWSLQ